MTEDTTHPTRPLVVTSTTESSGKTAVTLALALLADRRYVETALAGVVVGAATSLLGLLPVGFLPVGVRFLGEYGVGVAGFGAVLGLVLAVVGYYFGRDLRDGLTREVGA